MKKVMRISAAFLLLLSSAVLLYGYGRYQICSPIGEGPVNKGCGAKPACSGGCTRDNTDCKVCVGTENTNDVCNAPDPGAKCSKWQERNSCALAGLEPFTWCTCGAVWPEVPGSRHTLDQGCQ